MKILLDTHILIWFVTGDSRLSKKNSDFIQDQSVDKYFSLVSFWEIAIKTNIGKLKLSKSIDDLLPEGVKTLALDMEHIAQYQSLPLHHRDPFDRMLIAQAQAEGLTLMTDAPNFPRYNVPLII